jgi:Protein of unknown function (DUF2840)
MTNRGFRRDCLPRPGDPGAAVPTPPGLHDGTKSGRFGTLLTAEAAPELTHVELMWIKQRVENRIRFGRTDQEHVIDRHLRVVSFAVGSIFAFVRWAANDYGTVLSRIDILRAAAPGERYVTVPHVRPGGESLLHISGWPKVEKVLQAIEAVEALGIDPADVAPDHWQHVHNRLSVGDRPRHYTRSQHHAWLRRRRVMP